MTEAALVSVVALLGWLVLIWRAGALRGMEGRRKLRMVGIWLAAFVLVAIIFAAVGQASVNGGEFT